MRWPPPRWRSCSTCFGVVAPPIAVLVRLRRLSSASAELHRLILRRREKKRASGARSRGLKQAGKEFAAGAGRHPHKDRGAEHRAGGQDLGPEQEDRGRAAGAGKPDARFRHHASPNKAKDGPVDEPDFIERRARDTARSYLDSLGESELLETIRASLEENRVDLYLQPIVSLPQRKLRFYEALSRLRAEDGSVIMPAQYIKVAAPAGLMSVVDNLLLFRCVQIVRRLTAQAPRHRRVLQHLRRHADRCRILPAIPGIHAPQPRPGRPDRVRIRAGTRWPRRAPRARRI